MSNRFGALAEKKKKKGKGKGKNKQQSKQKPIPSFSHEEKDPFTISRPSKTDEHDFLPAHSSTPKSQDPPHTPKQRKQAEPVPTEPCPICAECIPEGDMALHMASSLPAHIAIMHTSSQRGQDVLATRLTALEGMVTQVLQSHTSYLPKGQQQLENVLACYEKYLLPMVCPGCPPHVVRANPEMLKQYAMYAQQQQSQEGPIGL
eukprot:gnl/Dysnectes_brevis/934_a1039_3568.p1 GENE.gnl/Dysnectes_brevis/934_a1039_3568~~gnl/Dysnectes_brevis/934_a1039_3568.p1  ORF type:complete len:204 (+),score=44.81 gnl/Dysnectes_brevis/934_a1039_3568:34-645(+)